MNISILMKELTMTISELEQNPFFYDEIVNKGKYYEAA